MSYFKVLTQGQTLVVNITENDATSVTTYTTSALSSSHTLPLTITSDTEFHFAAGANYAPHILTVSQPDGTELYSATVEPHPSKPHIIGPQATVSQIAGSLSTDQQIASEGVASGFSTMSRYACNAAPTMTSQVMRGAGFYAPSSMTVGSIKVITSSTAAAATPSLVRMGLYTIDSAGDATLVASTANDTALLAAANTGYTKALSSSYALTAGARYMVTLLVVTATTAPTVCGATLGGQEVGSQLPRLTMSKAAQADLPATLAESAMTDSVSAVYFELIPA